MLCFYFKQFFVMPNNVLCINIDNLKFDQDFSSIKYDHFIKNLNLYKDKTDLLHVTTPYIQSRYLIHIIYYLIF